MEIGNQIKALRAQRGITQETLAEKLNVSAQAVSKWERGAATPDIQLLPAISAYFGVSIDELFSLSDETRMERIQNMLWDERTLNPNTAEAERAFLLEKGKREPNNGEVYRLLADIEYQLSEEHRRAAVEYAKEGLKREPENNGVHSTFVQASQGEWGAWYSVEHHEHIDFYKKFVAENHIFVVLCHYRKIKIFFKNIYQQTTIYMLITLSFVHIVCSVVQNLVFPFK